MKNAFQDAIQKEPTASEPASCRFLYHVPYADEMSANTAEVRKLTNSERADQYKG